MVSPPLKSLAERIRGVGVVYVARSLYGRRNEETERAEQEFVAYDEIFVMRISTSAFRLIRSMSSGVIRTGLREYSVYALRLWVSLFRRKAPKQWKELSFEMLGGTIRTIPFDDLLQCTESDYADIARLEMLQTVEKKVIIHTGTAWVMKKWDNEKWAALLSRLQNLGSMRFIFVGRGDEDADDYAAIALRVGFPIYSLIGNDLLQLLLVLRRSDYFIGTDSGPRNLAHLADTRSLTILGPGPHFFMPWNKQDVVIDKSRGRGLYQMFVAKKSGFIHHISVEEVYEAFKSHLWNS
jgi:ADP-heptose:LPS heptosyltransferase